jgi:uncharacterized membrane protein
MVKKVAESKKKKDERKLFAFLATFLSIVGFVITLVIKRDDEYVMYYAKQSLIIFIIGAIAGILRSMLDWIPIIGWIIGFALTILVILIWIVSWMYALSGEKREIVFVSDWAKNIKL